MVGDAVKQVMAIAVRSRKPLVIERLEFAKKKAALENAGSGRARMLSSFAYGQAIQCLRAAAFRAGVEVLEVNPAYTSTIGAVNHAARFGISIHQGAAIAIARRGLGLSERAAIRVARVPTRGGGHVTLLLPAGLGEDMYGRSGRRSRDRSERRFERMCSCFPHPREAHRRLGVSRRRVLPDIAWCDPARESFPTAVRETWWRKMALPRRL
jgi:IS605 OrfB family transposase